MTEDTSSVIGVYRAVFLGNCFPELRVHVDVLNIGRAGEIPNEFAEEVLHAGLTISEGDNSVARILNYDGVVDDFLDLLSSWLCFDSIFQEFF